mgnify:CR=1 FL=1
MKDILLLIEEAEFSLKSINEVLEMAKEDTTNYRYESCLVIKEHIEKKLSELEKLKEIKE